MTTPNVLAYEDVTVMRPLVEALAKRVGAGEQLIFRCPFRWKTPAEGHPFDDAHVISNAYEMFSLESVAADRDWEVVYDFTHAAIVRPKPPA